MLDWGMTGGMTLLPLAERFETPPYYYLGLAALVGAMIWGAILAYRSWEEATEELDPASKDELLETFQQARIEGELDDEEFERVRRRIEVEKQSDGRPWTVNGPPGDARDGDDVRS